MVDGDNGKTSDVCRENMSADIRDTKTPAKVDIHGAGRTDAGVHARAMVASGRLNTDRTPDEIKDYLNRYLPADICALDVAVAGGQVSRKAECDRQNLRIYTVCRIRETCV